MQRKVGTGSVLCALCFVLWVVAAMAVPEVEPNDAVPQAIGTLGISATTLSVDGSSGYAGDLDWYSFDVTGDRAQTVRLATDSTTSWQLVLFSDSLVHIASATDALTQSLDPGRYRVRIQEADLGTDRYTLFISNAVERESNDGLVEAMSLGTLQTEPLTVFASIDPAGDVDFFSFDVPADFAAGLAPGFSRIVRIETPCPVGDTLLLLYAADKELGWPVPVARNDDAGAGSWSRLYLVHPAPGRYTLRVHEYADNEVIPTYRVAVTSMTLADSEPNDTPDQATPLGELKSGGRLETSQFIAEGDVDVFSFTVASPICALVATSGASDGDSIVCLLDEHGNELACDDDSGSGTWSRVFSTLAPGRYAISVRAANETSQFDYTLTVTPAACPSEAAESEPNDTMAQADAVDLPVAVAGEIGLSNPDVYRFVLPARAAVTAETYGDEDGDTTLCLLDANGEAIVCDDDSGAGRWSLVQAELEPGTYFVKVELYAGTGSIPYHLLIRTDPLG